MLKHAKVVNEFSTIHTEKTDETFASTLAISQIQANTQFGFSLTNSFFQNYCVLDHVGSCCSYTFTGQRTFTFSIKQHYSTEMPPNKNSETGISQAN